MTKTINTQGKRKRAIARASLKEGKGKIKVNGRFLDNYSNQMFKLKILEPVILAEDVAKKVDISMELYIEFFF